MIDFNLTINNFDYNENIIKNNFFRVYKAENNLPAIENLHKNKEIIILLPDNSFLIKAKKTVIYTANKFSVEKLLSQLINNDYTLFIEQEVKNNE